MQKTLRAWWRRTQSALMQMTEILPTLGFGRSPEPPFEPPQESTSIEPLGGGESPRAAQHDQQHVHPTDTQEHGHSQR